MRATVAVIGCLAAWGARALECEGTTCRSQDRVLRYGSAESVGLLPEPLREMVGNISAYTEPRNYGTASRNATRPLEPGSANLVARHGTIVSEFVTGKRLLYSDANGTLLPLHLQEDTTLDTVYDMASISKLFCATTLLRAIDAGIISLNDTVASHVPEFAANGKEQLTILQIVSHTSGLEPLPIPDLWKPEYATLDDRVYNGVFDSHLDAPPRTKFIYSDVGFQTMRFLLERVTGVNYEMLVYNWTLPLGMDSTFYNKGNIEGGLNPFYSRTAATEFQLQVQGPLEPARPQPVRGTVHDENTWALGGVSGHAGVFSSLHDMAVFAQMILNNGTYGGTRVLSPQSVDMIFTDLNAIFPGDNYGFGWALNQSSTQGSMQSLRTASHSGFTGTTIAIDRPSDTFWLHLANRVHPSRNWSTNNPVRRAAGYWVARSLGRNVAFPA